MDERPVPDPSGMSPLTRPLYELGERHSVLHPDATLKDIERAAILRALKSTDWNKQAAARLLGLRRPTLYSKMRRHGIPQRREEVWTWINSQAGLGVHPRVGDAGNERKVAAGLRYKLSNELAPADPLLNELKLGSALWDALEEIGRFRRVSKSSAYFLRHSDARTHVIGGDPDSAFEQLASSLAGISATHPAMRRSLECIRARALEEAETIPEEEQVK